MLKEFTKEQITFLKEQGFTCRKRKASQGSTSSPIMWTIELYYNRRAKRWVLEIHCSAINVRPKSKMASACCDVVDSIDPDSPVSALAGIMACEKTVIDNFINTFTPEEPLDVNKIRESIPDSL